MSDVVFILVPLAFFGVCALYVRGLDRMAATTDDGSDATGEEAAR